MSDSWFACYQSKLTTAEDAVRMIPPHSHVGMPDGAGEPHALIQAVCDNYLDLTDVTFFQASSTNGLDMYEPDMAGHIRYETFIASPGMKQGYWDALFQGRADCVPTYFSTVERDIRNDEYPIDVALLSLSRPDRHGYCSFGISVDYQRTIADKATLVIAQVNDQMPRTLGESFIHVSELDAIVEVSEPLAVSPMPPIGDTERRIGEFVASLVEDGDTIQAGIGKLPNAVMEALSTKRDLGVHSELFTTSMMELTNEGVLTNRRKSLHPGASVVTFAQGTPELYDWLDDNPSVQFFPVGYVNNPYVIAQNDHFVSVNSCVEVDLYGQVAAESIGPKQLSGAGGQVDFVRGAAMSAHGKSIIAMTSTARHGQVSRIRLYLDRGTPITTPRDEVQYIVTEYGIANLRGKSCSDRAQALIKIAHPDFREQLRDEYRAVYHVDPLA
ncbi:MAG: acetyl-CoA hydrolase/transferase family protein [Eggerthellaceae bacterium]|jgi:4-hydroxybutyrate CoA-transferase